MVHSPSVYLFLQTLLSHCLKESVCTRMASVDGQVRERDIDILDMWYGVFCNHYVR